MNSYVNEYLAVAQARRLEERARRRRGELLPRYGRRRRGVRPPGGASLVR